MVEHLTRIDCDGF